MWNRMRLAAGAVVALACAGVPARVQAQECRDGRAPGTVVRGTVLDSVTRVPLQRADVRLAWQAADGSERSHEQETDAGGRFRFCNVPADRLLSLRADYSKPGRTHQFRLAADDSAEVELEAQARPSQLRGRVVRADDGQPLASAEIRVLDTPLGAVSDGWGQFEIARIPPGTYHVRIEQLGYGVRTDSVVVDFRSSVELVAVLAPAPVRLPPLTVDVRSHDLVDAGFYDRREHGPGTFLVRQQWERRVPSKPSDVLRSVPGIRVQPARGGFDNVVLDRRGCAVRYFLDGVRTNPTFQLDEINVEWIEALEIYRGPSEVPPRFTGFSSEERATCGVVVIWTRSR
jgi:hypothetical protein